MFKPFVAMIALALSFIAYGQCPTSLYITFDNVQNTAQLNCTAVGGLYNLSVTGIDIGPNCCSGSMILHVTAPDISINTLTLNFVNSTASETLAFRILESSSANRIVNLGSVSKVGSTALLFQDLDILGNLSGSFGGDINSTSSGFHVISRISAGGDITASIKTRKSIVAGATWPGSIGRIESLNGGIFGDIRCAGPLTRISAATDIGTINDPVSIHVETDTVGQQSGDLGTIECNSLYANIIAAKRTTRISTRAGKFSGSLITQTILGGTDPGFYGLDIAGNLEAAITLTGTAPNDEFFIRGNFPDGGYVNGVSNYRISMPAGAFTKQMIVNGSNATSPAWTGQVIVGGTTISPYPYYDTSSALLSNEAIGLVPFMPKYNACYPAG